MCVITLGVVTINASELSAPSSDGPTCVSVGNVSANISGDCVQLYNSNGYNVTVTWTVYGHRENGTKSEVGGGVVVLGTTSETRQRNPRFTKSAQYTSYSVNIKAQKCN